MRSMIRSATVRASVLPEAIRIELIKSLLSGFPLASSISLTNLVGAFVLAACSGEEMDCGFAVSLRVISVFRVSVLLA